MGPGRRDRGDFNAKLEKHIERLPDYAEKAQQKLQRYFPPTAGATRVPERRRPSRPARPAARSSSWEAYESLPGFEDIKARWDRWHSPEAKLERRKRRRARALTLWVLLTIVSAVVLVAGIYFGTLPAGMDKETGIVGGAAGVLLFGTLGARSLVKLNGLKRTQITAVAAPPPLPPRTSAAREPMERLAEAEETLTELLNQLSESAEPGGSAVPGVSVADARATAADAAAALRKLAAKIQAVERARRNAPAREQAALDTSIETLRGQLDDGLEGYGELVAAAGRAVAAAGGGVSASREALTEATDHLAGLALALRELGS